MFRHRASNVKRDERRAAVRVSIGSAEIQNLRIARRLVNHFRRKVFVDNPRVRAFAARLRESPQRAVR
jgi:hypothetical protein